MENERKNEFADGQGFQNNYIGYTELHIAAEEDNVYEILKLIHQPDCDLDAVIPAGSKRGFTALHLAAEFQFTSAIKILLQNGADFTLENANNETPLHIACRNKNNYAIEMIFKAFCTACSKINKDIKKLFSKKDLPIYHDIKFSEEFWKNFKPLHFAVKFQLTDIAMILINSGLDVDATDSNGMTALHCLVNELSAFKGTDSTDTTALARVVHRFAENVTGFGRTIFVIDQIIHLFMAKCKDMKSIVDDYGRTPLSYLYESVHRREHLLSRLKYSTLKCNRLIPDCVRVNLIEQMLRIPAISANLHVADCKGNTILHSLAKASPRSPTNWEAKKIVQRYLAEGGDINALNHAGYAPLHYSIHKNNMSVSEALMRSGADINVMNAHGDSAYSILRRSKPVYHLAALHLFSYLRRQVVFGVPLCPANMEYYERDNELVEDRGFPVDKCKAELELMKAERIDAYTTLYDILHKNAQDLFYHSSNAKLLKKDFLKRFPIYGYLVKNKLESAKNRAVMFEPASEALTSVTKFDFPEACVHAIFKHLEIIDIKNLIEAKVNEKQ